VLFIANGQANGKKFVRRFETESDFSFSWNGTTNRPQTIVNFKAADGTSLQLGFVIDTTRDRCMDAFNLRQDGQR